MKGQPNRLDGNTQPLLAGSAIDRGKPIQFQLNGRAIAGFAGDTVFSATLASGIDTVGLFEGQPLRLSERFAPAITFGRDNDAPSLPMTRVPALDGADIYTVGRAKRPNLPLFGAARRSLHHKLDRVPLSTPWSDAAPRSAIASDVVIVGGGVAGLSAALAAAKADAKVTLLEASPILGGCARYFGAQEGDETPDASIARLIAAVAANDAITTVLRTEVLAVHRGRARAHCIRIDGPSISGEIIDYTAPRIVLANGAVERLPVFPGNRLPGVITTMEAYLLAERYGVWLGQSAIFATTHSAAYRLPMLLSDAGITTSRIADTRLDPQSRFIEYAKAYGIMQAGGTIPVHAETARKGRGLAVTLHLDFDGYVHNDEPLATDTMLVCGGWQPDLALWHMAGGRSRWNAQRHRIEPIGSVQQVALAGSAGGYFSKHACLASGQDAIKSLFGTPRIPVVELAIDPIYETPDAATPTVSRSGTVVEAAYLDDGLNLIQPPDHRPDSRPRWWPFRAVRPTWSLADQPHALGIGDVAAGVQLGGIPADSAGIVAQERTVASGNLIDSARLVPKVETVNNPWTVPAYLTGRFGANAQLWIVTPTEPRALDVGALIFLNSDQTDPRQAIGAVIRIDATGAIALIGKPSPQPGDGVILRDQDRAFAIRLIKPVSAPPFGGAASAA